MKYGYLRAAAVSPALRVADPAYNAARICEAIGEAENRGVELLVFPELSLSGYTCGDLFLQDALREDCLSALGTVAQATAGRKMLVFVGLPLAVGGKLYNCAAGVADGKVLGFVPKKHIPNYAEFYEARYFAACPGERACVSFGGDAVPVAGDLLFCDGEAAVACEICEDLWAAGSPSEALCRAGATVVVNLSASDETVGKREYRRTLVSAQSGKNVCAYVYCDAGTTKGSDTLPSSYLTTILTRLKSSSCPT